MKYNQTEGVNLDRSIGPISHWKWHDLNEPALLKKVMVDTYLPHKESEILKLGGPPLEKNNTDEEQMLAIEYDNYIREKHKKSTQKFQPFHIKMKAVKLNENFSLKVLNQSNIYLTFRDGPVTLKLNLGMVLDHEEIIDTVTAEVGEVVNGWERVPACSLSADTLQRDIARTRRAHVNYTQRQTRLKRPQRNYSIDQLKKGMYKPIRRLPIFMPSSTTNTSSRTFVKCCSYDT